MAFAMNVAAQDAAAQADERHFEPAKPTRRAVQVGVDAALTTSPNGPTVSSLGGALSLLAGYRFASGIDVSLAGGVTAVSLDIEGQPTRRGTFPGNVLLGVAFERVLRSAFEVGASFRAGAPVALFPGGIDDNRLAELAYNMAASAQGFRGPFIWQTNVVPLVLGAHASLRPIEWLTLTARVNPAYLLSVNQRPSRLAVASQVDATAALHHLTGHVGLTHFASTLPLENRHLDQLALHFGAGAVMDGQRWMLDFSIGLDAPYGVLEEAPHPWWGIAIVGDAYFGSSR
jgi:hypothetical protein